MKAMMSFFMAMVMAFALVSTVAAADLGKNSGVFSTAPAYTDFVDSRDLPHKAGVNDLQVPDAFGY